ncbi:MAG: DNA-processing protein DprA [Persicimonas sp.]
MANFDDLTDKTRGFGAVDAEERAARYSAWRVGGIGYRRMARLVDETGGGVAGLFAASAAAGRDVLARAQLPKKVRARLEAKLAAADPAAEFAEELDGLPADTRIYHLAEPGYPRRLLELSDPPVFVFVRGDLGFLDYLSTVAIVGSRKATVRDTRLARAVARELAEAGVSTVSGGALGIDAAAHRGCLDGRIPTLAVLAGGVDRPSPKRNAEVFEAAVSCGALVSEYPCGTQPRHFHFQRRNALIAALGDATVVVRAGEKSGTLITARAAAEIGRPICAFPGPLDEPLVAGCHELLVEGAQCVRGAADILEYVLGRLPARPVMERGGQLRAEKPGGGAGQKSLFEAKRAAGSSTTAPVVGPAIEVDVGEDAKAALEELRRLVEVSGTRCVHVDELKRSLDMEARRVDALLLELELCGAISKKPGANAFVL